MTKAIMLFLLLSSMLNAQPFEHYMHHTNRAELLVAAGEYSAALSHYDMAFARWETPFAKDYRNALQCAVLSGDTERGYTYCRALILLGCELEFFRAQARLKPFRASKEWWRLIGEYGALRQAYIQRCNWALRTKIEELKNRDQYWRNQDPTYTVLRDSIFREDDRIMEEVLEIFRQGYPTEWEIGVFVMRDTTIQNDPLSIILLHNYVRNEVYKRSPDLTEELLGYVKAGEMHPEVFASLNDRADDHRIEEGFGYESFAYKVNNKYYAEKKPAAHLEKIEQWRKKLGLDTIEEMRRKVVFQYCSHPGSFDFFMGEVIATVDNMPEPILKAFFEEIPACAE